MICHNISVTISDNHCTTKEYQPIALKTKPDATNLIIYGNAQATEGGTEVDLSTTDRIILPLVSKQARTRPTKAKWLIPNNFGSYLWLIPMQDPSSVYETVYNIIRNHFTLKSSISS